MVRSVFIASLYLIPSAARDLAGDVSNSAGKIPRCARDEVCPRNQQGISDDTFDPPGTRLTR
jgi:hypothetical protein